MREFEITLNEAEANLIIELLISYERRCRANGQSAVNNGYGSGISLSKKEAWDGKAQEANVLNNRICEKMS